MSRSVLILEDESLIAWDIEEELTARGWRVLGTAANLAAAAQVLDGGQPDLAVLDVNLGNATSYDLARRCRDEGIAVVFLTGESRTSRPDDLQDVPICSKPVVYDNLDRTMEAALKAARKDCTG